MGAAAGGIAVAGPIVTTFNVPAAAALTSGCTCTAGKTVTRKEFFWNDPFGIGSFWIEPPTTTGSCRPSCWASGQATPSDAFINRTSSFVQNSPITISRGTSCDDDANEGLFQVTALYPGSGTDCVADPAGDGTISFTQSTATVTAAAGRTLIRVPSSSRAAEEPNPCQHFRPWLLDPQQVPAFSGELEADLGPPASGVADLQRSGEIAAGFQRGDAGYRLLLCGAERHGEFGRRHHHPGVAVDGSGARRGPSPS